MRVDKGKGDSSWTPWRSLVLYAGSTVVAVWTVRAPGWPAGVAVRYGERVEKRRGLAWEFAARFPFFLCRQTHNMAD